MKNFTAIHANQDGTFAVRSTYTGLAVKGCEMLSRVDAEFQSEIWNDKFQHMQRRNNTRLRRAGLIGDVVNAYGFAMKGEKPIFTEYV